ncbi:hypothetical protein V8G54_018698, partial [Vigna mungo]
AAEALGAIGSEGNVPLLKNSLDSDPAEEVRETCELALQRIQHLKDAGNTDELAATEISPFKSVDPAVPATSCTSVQQLSVALLEEFTADPEPLVSQSCEVALSMLEFERSGKSFEVYTIEYMHFFCFNVS